jgi:hypothetical protein
LIALVLGCTAQLEGWDSTVATWSREPGPPPVYAWIDADGDGDDELFLSGGADQRDAVLDLVDGRLVDRELEFELGSLVPAEAALAADLNGDAHPDLLVLREDGLHSYQSTTQGFVEIHRWLPQTLDARVTGLDLGDVDRDGDADVLVGLDRAPGALLYRNDGPLGLREIGQASGLQVDEGLDQVLFFDLDQDGREDVLLRGSRTRAFLNSGLGPFGELSWQPSPRPLQSLSLEGERQRHLVLVEGPSAVLDLDGDRFEDLAVAGPRGPRIYLQRQRSLVSAEGPELPWVPHSVAAGQVDEQSPAELIWIPADGAPVLWRRNP